MYRLALAVVLTSRLAVGAPHAMTGDDLGPAVLTLAHVAAHFELPLPHPIIDRFVRWQLGLRDLVRGAADRLTAVYVRFADRVAPAIPDLTILTTDPIAHTESSGYGWRDDPIRHDPRFHSGTDFRAKPGTPVVAAGDGVVVFCGRQGGYGNVIYIDHGGGVITRYAHLRKIETKKDATIAAGERIGQVGSTGRTTGPHLHFEIRLDGRAVDPVTAMTVAEIERESPAAGRLATYALAPELQARSRDRQDQPHRKDSRPERPNRAKRTQVLW